MPYQALNNQSVYFCFFLFFQKLNCSIWGFALLAFWQVSHLDKWLWRWSQFDICSNLRFLLFVLKSIICHATEQIVRNNFPRLPSSSTSGCPALTPEFASTNVTITPPLPGHLGALVHFCLLFQNFCFRQMYTTCPTRGTVQLGPSSSLFSPSSILSWYQHR